MDLSRIYDLRFTIYARWKNRRDKFMMMARPHPSPVGGVPNTCKSVSRFIDCRLRDGQTQARHKMVSRKEIRAPLAAVLQFVEERGPSTGRRNFAHRGIQVLAKTLAPQVFEMRHLRMGM